MMSVFLQGSSNIFIDNAGCSYQTVMHLQSLSEEPNNASGHQWQICVSECLVLRQKWP